MMSVYFFKKRILIQKLFKYMKLIDIVKSIQEKSRYSKETGEERYTTPEEEIEQVFQYAAQNNVPLFGQYSNIPKLGLNPQSIYNTPIGIYAYPASVVSKEQFKTGNVPFASERKYIMFFTTPNPDQLLIIDRSGNAKTFQNEIQQFLNQQTKQQQQQHKQKIQELANNMLQQAQSGMASNPQAQQAIISYFQVLQSRLQAETPQIYLWTSEAMKAVAGFYATVISLVQDGQLHYNPQAFQNFQKTYKTLNDMLITNQNQNDWAYEARVQTVAGQFWNITREMSGRNPTKWAQLFMQMGIQGVVDEGSGIVHPLEPIQAVFFNPQAVKLLKMVDNPAAKGKKLAYPKLDEASKKFLFLFKSHLVPQLEKLLKMSDNTVAQSRAALKNTLDTSKQTIDQFPVLNQQALTNLHSKAHKLLYAIIDGKPELGGTLEKFYETKLKPTFEQLIDAQKQHTDLLWASEK